MTSTLFAATRGRTSNEISDEDLVVATRQGDVNAYAVLWERHAGAGRRAARAVTSSIEPDDLVSEAFASILSAIKNGGGPSEAFRPYLFTTIRNVAATWGRKGTDLPLDEFVETPVDGAEDPIDQYADRSLLVQTFRQLPERWKTLLWYLEVEGMKPREIAPIMGMTPNAVSALAYRAREGFRQAWLDAHINDVKRPADCRWVCERVVLQGRHPLARADRGRFAAHLSDCRACQIVAADIDNVSLKLRAVLLPLLLGGPAAFAYTAEAAPASAAAASMLLPIEGSIPILAAAPGDTTSIYSGSALVATETARSMPLAIGLGAGLSAAGVAMAAAIWIASTGWVDTTNSADAAPPASVTRIESPAVVLADPDPVELVPPIEIFAPVEVFAPIEALIPVEPAPTVSAAPVEAAAPPALEPLVEVEVEVVDVPAVTPVETAARQVRQVPQEEVEVIDPLAYLEGAVPRIGGPAGSRIASLVDGDADGDVDDALVDLHGVPGAFVRVIIDGTEARAIYELTAEATTVALTDISLGRHDVVVSYIDPNTGRTGAAAENRLVVAAEPTLSE